tara:strand:+ start:1135 stop:1383 length:249 start_codon:yes stop_codon:yes gene_type:complete
MAKQKLSPKAASAKKKRDLEFAKTPMRRKKKAENQKARRAFKKRGFKLKGKDVHHCPKTGRMMLVSVKSNRGNFGKGTKKEG